VCLISVASDSRGTFSLRICNVWCITERVFARLLMPVRQRHLEVCRSGMYVMYLADWIETG
jgi:hypothetical protein